VPVLLFTIHEVRFPPGGRHSAFGSRVTLVRKSYSFFSAAGRTASIFMMLVFALARLGYCAAGQGQARRLGVEKSLLADHSRPVAAEAAAHYGYRMPMRAFR
jgi:hypothetical protein